MQAIGSDSSGSRDIVSFADDGNRIGLADSESAHSGVSRNAGNNGCIKGPPAAVLYAVDPVDVDMITPSPLICENPKSPLLQFMSNEFDIGFLLTAISLRTQYVLVSFSPQYLTHNLLRGSTQQSPRRILGITSL